MAEDGCDGEDEVEGPDGPTAEDAARWMDGVLPLLTFVIAREDTTVLVAALLMVLTLRAIAGFFAGRRNS